MVQHFGTLTTSFPEYEQDKLVVFQFIKNPATINVVLLAGKDILSKLVNKTVSG